MTSSPGPPLELEELELELEELELEEELEELEEALEVLDEALEELEELELVSPPPGPPHALTNTMAEHNNNLFKTLMDSALAMGQVFRVLTFSIGCLQNLLIAQNQSWKGR